MPEMTVFFAFIHWTDKEGIPMPNVLTNFSVIVFVSICSSATMVHCC